jgi:DNA-binding response OmpR family regulator
MVRLVEKPRILVVEDSSDMRSLLREMLEAEGYPTVAAEDGQQGLRLLYAQHPSLVITDLAMPNMDGMAMIERIREVSEVPVLILSGSDDEPHKVQGLRRGADDYVVNPVRRGELLARVDALLRRAARHEQTEPSTVDKDAALYVDFARHEVRLRGKPVDLSPQEFRLLAAFLRQPGAVLSPERLLDAAWGSADGGPENVRVYMGYLRRKLERDHRDPDLLETVRGFGYRYNVQRG